MVCGKNWHGHILHILGCTKSSWERGCDGFLFEPSPSDIITAAQLINSRKYRYISVQTVHNHDNNNNCRVHEMLVYLSCVCLNKNAPVSMGRYSVADVYIMLFNEQNKSCKMISYFRVTISLLRTNLVKLHNWDSLSENAFEIKKFSYNISMNAYVYSIICVIMFLSLFVYFLLVSHSLLFLFVAFNVSVCCLKQIVLCLLWLASV